MDAVSAGEDEKFTEMDGTDHCTIMWMLLKVTEQYTEKII